MFESSNQRQFQKGLDTDKMLSSRRDSKLSLRRQAREAHLQKRMRTLSAQDTAPTRVGETPPSVDKIPTYVANVMNPDSLHLQVVGVRSLRMLLSQQRNPPIQRVSQSGVVPKIVSFLSNPDDDIEPREIRVLTAEQKTNQKLRMELQHEAAWIVTNLSSTTSAKYVLQVVNCGCIEKLVTMIRKTQSEEHVDMAMWALGNISGEDRAMAQRLLQTGFLEDMIKALPTMSSMVLKNATWAMSNVLRNYPHLTREQQTLIPALCHILRTANVPEVMTSVLWSFVFLSNNDDLALAMSKHSVVADVTQMLGVEAQKYKRTLVRLRAEQKKADQQGNNKSLNIVIEAQKAMDHHIYKPCLRFLGNVLSGPDELTQTVLDAGYLDILEPFVDHFSSSQRKEVIWSISNVLAGSVAQIEAVLSRDGLLRSILQAGQSSNQAVKREATWCLGNATVDAVSHQIKKLAEFGAIEVLCRMLSPAYELCDDHVKIIVEALDAFLKIYGVSGYNPYAVMVEEYKGLDYLEDRQSDSKISEETFDCIVRLMQRYWSSDDFIENDGDDLALKDQLAAAVDNSTNTFVFGCGHNGENMSILGNAGHQQTNREAGNAIYQF